MRSSQLLFSAHQARRRRQLVVTGSTHGYPLRRPTFAGTDVASATFAHMDAGTRHTKNASTYYFARTRGWGWRARKSSPAAIPEQKLGELFSRPATPAALPWTQHNNCCVDVFFLLREMTTRQNGQGNRSRLVMELFRDLYNLSVRSVFQSKGARGAAHPSKVILCHHFSSPLAIHMCCVATSLFFTYS